jgi:transcriptional regulator
MYLPPHFEEQRPEELRRLMLAHPLGELITFGPRGLSADHVPMEFDPEPQPLGTLRCHVARANPLWREHQQEVEVLVVFQGPSAYVSPSWYPSKQETGKVVPTYNYAVVHAYGSLRVVDDPVWLRAQVDRLTQRHEAVLPKPWSIADAPEDYIQSMLRAIVGIEIEVTRLSGKWKISQNRSLADRAGVARGLGRTGDAGADMAQLVNASLGDSEAPPE